MAPRPPETIGCRPCLGIHTGRMCHIAPGWTPPQHRLTELQACTTGDKRHRIEIIRAHVTGWMMCTFRRGMHASEKRLQSPEPPRYFTGAQVGVRSQRNWQSPRNCMRNNCAERVQICIALAHQSLRRCTRVKGGMNQLLPAGIQVNTSFNNAKTSGCGLDSAGFIRGGLRHARKGPVCRPLRPIPVDPVELHIHHL